MNQEDEVVVCDCGFDMSKVAKKGEKSDSISVSEIITSSNKTKDSSIEKKYPSLRTISSYFDLIAWLNLIISIFFAIVTFKIWGFDRLITTIPVAMGFFLWGGIGFVLNSAFSELIIVALDIEENLRKLIFIGEKIKN